MFYKTNSPFFKSLFQTGLCLISVFGICHATVEGGCGFPAYSQDTFRKVYRSNKLFLEGVADLTGDGKLDAYGYELQANNTYKNIVILPNNGSGGLGDPVIINTAFKIEGNSRKLYGLTYNGLTPTDLNGDGKVDLVVLADTAPPVVYTYFNDGMGGFTQSPPTVVGDFESVGTTADINTDGRPDLITGTYIPFQPGSLKYRPGNADGTYGAGIELASNFNLPVFADFNGDGKIDFSLYSTNGTVSYPKVFINLGGGIFSAIPERSGPAVDNGPAVDLNGDGKIDLSGSNVGLNDGTGVFTSVNLPYFMPPGVPASYVYPEDDLYVSDFDGDGDKDFFFRGGGRSQWEEIRKRYHFVYINNGSGSFTRQVIPRPYLGFPADINGDGKDEEVIFLNATNQESKATTTNETAVIVRSKTCTAPPVHGQTKLIDFNGDNISDIAYWNENTGVWQYWTTFHDGSVTWGGASFGDKPVPGDYDGDGKTDAAVFREPTGDWWILRSSDGTFTWTHFGATGDVPTPADFNGDGKTDIAVFRPSVGDWYVDYSDSPDYTFLHFGATGDQPVPADFDGDGRDNIALFRPSSGDWYYLTSTFDNFVGVHWGAPGDQPVPADFDMDGKADITVYRPSQRAFLVFRSYDNGFFAYGYDAAPVIPMAVDTDGDGVMQFGNLIASVTTCQFPNNCITTTGSWRTTGAQDPWAIQWWGVYGRRYERPLRIGLPN